MRTTELAFPRQLPSCRGSVTTYQTTCSKLTDSDSILCARLNADGYIHIRSFFNRERIAQCQTEVLEVMFRAGCCKSPSDATITGPEAATWSLLKHQSSVIPLCPTLHALLEDDRLFAFIGRLLAVGDIRTIPYKWLRAGRYDS